MIARIGTFLSLSPEAASASRRNLIERFLPALKEQEGFIGGFWLNGADGRHLSITVWESEEAMRRGADRANAAPLLPGQNAAQIPGPDTTELCEVVAVA